MITPRGKFDMYMLKSSLKIHGPSHDYKILYKNITKAFMLPKPDGVHVSFVIALANPLRQGNTTYNFLVFQFKHNNQKEINLNLPSNEEERLKILKSDLNSNLNGEVYDIIARLFSALVGVPIIIPKNFKGQNDSPAVRCSIKANEGFLYPLERSLIFIHKPVVVINLDSVISVECSRVNETNVQKSFDMTIKTKKSEMQFLGIDKKELNSLCTYFQQKNVKVKSNDGNNTVEITANVRISLTYLDNDK